jgi:organic hydroperoxide reductase OsmC/OhrA
MVVRSRIAWLSSPPHGKAHVGVESRSFTALPLSMSRSQPEPGETTPGELLAAAHGSALAVILSRMLEDRGAAAREIVVETTYELEGDWYEVSRIDFDVRARLMNGGEDSFLDELAGLALDRCAQSLGLIRDRTTVRVSAL